MTTTPTHRNRAPLSHSGFTLVELLVAVVIGLALTLALTTITIRSETGKRVLSSGNDMAQNTAFVTYELDRSLRSAGSGFAQSWTLTAACPLNVSQGGTQILPRLTAFPAPFATVPAAVAIAPVLIHAGAGGGGSDVLALMTGAAGLSEAPVRISPQSATGTSVLIDNTIGLRGNDLVLFAQQGGGCLVQQVASPFTGGTTPQLNFGGSYAAPVVNGLALSGFGAGANVDNILSLGNVTGNRPIFQLLGIDASATLVSYDLLRLDNTDATPALANGVVDMRAVYGVDLSNPQDGTVDAWFPPTNANFTVAALTARTQAALDRLRSIKAVRIGLILRSDRIEKETVSPSSLTLFANVPGITPIVRNLSADEQRQRFRTVEFTVPLRNVIMVP